MPYFGVKVKGLTPAKMSEEDESLFLNPPTHPDLPTSRIPTTNGGEGRHLKIGGGYSAQTEFIQRRTVRPPKFRG